MKEAFGIKYEIVHYEIRCFHLVNGKAKLLIEECDEWPEEVGSAETRHIAYRCGKCGEEIVDGYVNHAFFCSKRYAVIEAAQAMFDSPKAGIGQLKRAVEAYEKEETDD